MKQPYSIPCAIFVAVSFAAIGLVPETARSLPPTHELWFICIPAILLGVPFSIWLPQARVGRMREIWKLPYYTFLLPRWVVRLVGTTSIGVTAGSLILTIATDSRFGLLFGMQLAGTIVFVISARRRFARHPSSEFAMAFPSPRKVR